MNVSRTPPGQDKALDRMTAQFDTNYFAWRKLCQKTNASRVRILRALEKDGCVGASEMLGEKPRYEMQQMCWLQNHEAGERMLQMSWMSQ